MYRLLGQLNSNWCIHWWKGSSSWGCKPTVTYMTSQSPLHVHARDASMGGTALRLHVDGLWAWHGMDHAWRPAPAPPSSGCKWWGTGGRGWGGLPPTLEECNVAMMTPLTKGFSCWTMSINRGLRDRLQSSMHVAFLESCSMLSWDEGVCGHTTANELSCTVQIFDDILTPSQINLLSFSSNLWCNLDTGIWHANCMHHWQFQTQARPGKILVSYDYCFTRKFSCYITAPLRMSPAQVTWQLHCHSFTVTCVHLHSECNVI